MSWVEGDLRFDFPKTVRVRRFDDGTHGLSHCMKAVDFILETKDAYYFIEVKDPDHPATSTTNKAVFSKDLQAGELKKNLTGKYRDTFLYHWAEEKDPDKPIHYIVLLSMKALDAAELLAQQDALRRNLPLIGASSWKRPIAKSCMMLSLEAWNIHFKQWPVFRVSAA